MKAYTLFYNILENILNGTTFSGGGNILALRLNKSGYQALSMIFSL